MFKKGLCAECNKETLLVNQKYKLCNYHNIKRLNKGKPRKIYKIPKKSEKQKKVNAEDLAFFKEIWNERPHYSEVSGEPLGDEFNVCFFSHILTKGSYPRFRHCKKNILLMSFQEHQEWEFADRKDPKWNPVRDLSEELIIEYYKPK
jgi:hypothetical protein